jgi:competence protein ComEA
VSLTIEVSKPTEVPRPAPEKRWRDRVADQAAAARSRVTLVSFGRIATSAGAVLVIAAAALWLLRSPTPAVESALPRAKAGPSVSSSAPPGGSPGAVTSVMAGVIVVQAAGAVVKPGVYRLPPGSRVTDLIAAAGGVEQGVDESVLPLAAKVVDGQRVYVPRPGEPTPVVPVGGSAGGVGGVPTGPVNLNQATVEQLDALPGVGPSTAAAIIAYRDKHGPFRSVNGLLDVPGIGDGKLAALRDLVTV